MAVMAASLKFWFHTMGMKSMAYRACRALAVPPLGVSDQLYHQATPGAKAA